MARKRKTKKSTNRGKKTKNKIKNKIEIINENNNSISTHELPQNNARENIEVKRPILAPNGKTFYPCHYCSKIFPRETTCKSHMNKCSSKSVRQANGESKNDKIQQEETEKASTTNQMIAPNGKLFYPCQYCGKIFAKHETSKSHKEKCLKKINSQSNITSSKMIVDKQSSETDINVPKKVDSNKEETLNINGSSSSSTENKDQYSLEDDDVQIIQKEIPKYDLSVYEYDEDTTDEVTQNKDTKCKLCPFIAENPIELLRHKRNVHVIPKKILTPDEIQKYFDWPDRNLCPVCDKPLKSRNFRSVFIKHLLVHTTGLTFECKICKKKFRRADHMRAHEKRHVITYDELQAIQNAKYDDDVALKQHLKVS